MRIGERMLTHLRASSFSSSLHIGQIVDWPGIRRLNHKIPQTPA